MGGWLRPGARSLCLAWIDGERRAGGSDRSPLCGTICTVGRWVGGWVGWVEEKQALRMSYCGFLVGGWVGGRTARRESLSPVDLRPKHG